MENGAISGIFGPITGKQEFSQTKLLCQFEVLINYQLHAKYQKNVMSSLEKITQVWKTGQFWVYSVQFLGKKEFS